VDAEAVLLVDNGEGEIVEFDLVLEQCMGADQEVDVAGGEAVESAGAVAAALASGEDRDAQAGGFRERRATTSACKRKSWRRCRSS
jgi:hypothetical protein